MSVRNVLAFTSSTGAPSRSEVRHTNVPLRSLDEKTIEPLAESNAFKDALATGFWSGRIAPELRLSRLSERFFPSPVAKTISLNSRPERDDWDSPIGSSSRGQVIAAILTETDSVAFTICAVAGVTRH